MGFQLTILINTRFGNRSTEARVDVKDFALGTHTATPPDASRHNFCISRVAAPTTGDGVMEIKQPSAATFPGFRHIHRTLLPGECLPTRPTLLEQLQALSGPSSYSAPEENVAETDVEEEELDEEWSEMS